jgi:radical SAM-linked protein
VRFGKSAPLIFIGHLDFLRVFQKTIRRSGLPAAFSQGFNPHLLVSFALPLPVGMASTNDVADIVLAQEAPQIYRLLQAAAPQGLDFSPQITQTDNKCASIIAMADYTFEYPHALPPTDVLSREHIVIEKKTKKGMKQIDIRPNIFDIQTRGNTLHMRLSAGSAQFLSPFSAAGLVTDTQPISTTRTALFDATGTPL